MPCGKSHPGPPVGPALGPHGVSAPQFVQQFNDRTKSMEPGLIIPVVITVYADKTFTFILKTPPASVLIKKAAGIDKGSKEPHKVPAGKIPRAKCEEIARLKMPDLTANDVDAAMRIIAGTARSMGVEVEKMRHGKKYRESVKKYDAAVFYDLKDALSLVKSMAFAKFDETVDLSVKLNLKKSQSVRDTVVLPNQFKGEKKVLVFCKPEKEKEAQDAGAAFVGADDLIEKIKGGWTEFDVAVATPDMMKDVGKLGMVLGRKGLMPNPKTGTVTFDLKGALAELRKGRTEFRADKTGVVHLAIGKVSMEAEKLAENIQTVVNEIKRKRPPDAKGDFIRSVSVASTMGPGVWVRNEGE